MKEKRILVVDDEAINRLFLKSLLNNNGWVVEEAEEGEEAVNLASKEIFDAILMDVNMPFIDGFEATRRIRKASLLGRRGTPVPILALSAHNDEEFFRECEESGMDGVITKPVTETKLLRKLSPYLSETEE
ncbi:MAG: response regulator [Spirochaetaceae bacterium]